jgi:hypothetical protein
MALLLLPLAGVPASAHHAAAPFYDQARTVEIEGVVTRFVFKNPHAFLYIEVTDEKGTKTEWAVELGAPIILSRAGWTPETIKAGDPIRAKGAPSRAAGTHGIGFGTLTRPDGRTFVDEGR